MRRGRVQKCTFYKYGRKENSDLASKEIATGITGVQAFKSGNVVTLYGAGSWSVSAGGTVDIGVLSVGLRPISNIVFGVASAGFAGGRAICDVELTNAGNLYIASANAITAAYFSLTYVAQ
jgi:hypothetical protein